ncbi:hypothetical protein ACRS6B_26930 [Nocardia asteroides]
MREVDGVRGGQRVRDRDAEITGGTHRERAVFVEVVGEHGPAPDDQEGPSVRRDVGGDHPGDGLTGLRHRVEGVGGELDILSEAGRGTTFCARLPEAPETGATS